MSTEEEKEFFDKVGSNIRLLRHYQNLSQEDLAQKSNLDRTYIGGIERGERNPTILTFKKVADALSVPIEKILSNDLEKNLLGIKKEKE
ncbi:helix-turn-helix transcriptional regulator [Planococcus sp. S3-L1]|uniref:helix-turn-helix domain-containing protein n=1 Tax=Planococcus sp. S3-L1 TaxID=3046200 RepID=UPI0024BAF066|nr:helix-turn-helix transcriptional regulator [Planococcus sp. S3-L1]MDJ0333021.1 helix-turn-helix transcriptional regulator [Planococcus sp. S3-L1]